MTYTVKKLAKLSGVSVRTLHFYDEIGLLKPATYGDNGYRYYGEEQLLLLQQILFYKELGFQLSEIQKIVTSNDFDKITALKSHRKLLEQSIQKTHQLIQNIDSTLRKLEGGHAMKDEELYYGFSKAKQEEYDAYLIERYGPETKDRIEESKQKTKTWKKEDFDAVKNAYHQIHQRLTDLINAGEKASSNAAQDIIRKHHEIVSRFYIPSKEIYAGLGQLYLEHPDFRNLYDSYHPELAAFLAEAMRIFTEIDLSVRK